MGRRMPDQGARVSGQAEGGGQGWSVLVPSSLNSVGLVLVVAIP